MFAPTRRNQRAVTRWFRLLPFWLAIAFALTCPPALTQTTTQILAPGIVFTQEITGGAAPLVINALRIDLSAKGVRVQTGQAQDAVSLDGAAKGRETVHSLAARHHALAAVNADFFPFTGDPLGISVRDGELISEPAGNRACIGISDSRILMNVLASIGTLTGADQAAIALSGINRVPHDGDIVVLTPTYAATPAVDKSGFVLTLRNVDLPVRLSQTMQGTIDSIAPIGSGEQISQTTGHTIQIVGVGQAASALPAHCKQGDVVRFRFDVTPSLPLAARGKYPSRTGDLRSARYVPVWGDIQQAVGGGPLLVRDGQIAVDGEAEGFGKSDFIDKRHPRTAAGVDSKGSLLLVTVDGRSPLSQGVSLDEMAAIMKRLGAVQAMNFDGGGSTTMTVGGGVVNAPSDGRERPIADGLLVYGDAPEADADASNELTIVSAATKPPLQAASDPDANSAVKNVSAADVSAGQPCRFQIMDADNKPVRSLRALWGTVDGFGFISQQGVFTSFHSGIGTITARVGSRVLRAPVRVTAGSPARIDASLTAIANSGPERSLLTISVMDKFGNPLPDQPVTLEAPGASLETLLVTNKKGIARAILTWSVPPDKRLLTATVGTVRSLPVRGDSVKPAPPPAKEPLDPDDRP